MATATAWSRDFAATMRHAQLKTPKKQKPINY